MSKKNNPNNPHNTDTKKQECEFLRNSCLPKSCKPNPCLSTPCNKCYCACPTGATGATGATGPTGPTGPVGLTGPTGPFLSSYCEVLGDEQTVATGANIVFDVGSQDSVGNNIVLSSDGTVFTINRTGLYLVEWNINLSASTQSTAQVVVGIIENGESSSGSAAAGVGNFSSGTLIQVGSTPFTLTLLNYGDEITLVRPSQWQDAAASIRIVRFADGPTV